MKIILAMKPVDSFVSNVVKHGIAGLNIDGCRIEANGEPTGGDGYIGLRQERGWNSNNMPYKREQQQSKTLGRWPSNLIHDGSDEVMALFPEVKGKLPFKKKTSYNFNIGIQHKGQKYESQAGLGTIGSAARFFYQIKDTGETDA